MRRTLLLILGAASIAAAGCGGDTYVATGGSFSLTPEELRLEFTKLGPSAGYEDTYQFREYLVGNLATRHYLSEEALEKGYAAGEIEAVTAEALRSAAGEAYRRWKVDNSILLPRIKTKPWIDKLDRRLNLVDLRFAVYQAALEAEAALSKGRDFQTLAAELEQRPDVFLFEPGWVVWKQLGREVANAVFRLDAGDHSDVVKGADGYHIYYIAEDQPFGLSIELVSLRSQRFHAAMVKEELEEEMRRELAGRYDVEFEPEGVSTALSAFEKALTGERPPDELMTARVAVSEVGDLVVGDIFNEYYSLPAPSRPYVSDAVGIMDFALDLLMPDMEGQAGMEMGLDRLPEVLWEVKRARQDLLVSRMEEEFTRDISVSEEEIAEYYEDKREQLRTPGGYRARRILVGDMEEARRVMGHLASGRDFAEVAAEMSKDEFTAARGGDLTYIEFGLIDHYDPVVADLEPGQTSRPFETPAGVEILKLEEKDEPRILDLEEARPSIVTFITNTRANTLLEEWVEAKKAEVEFTINEELLRRIDLPPPDYTLKGSRVAGEEENEE
jgi:parvulin-like peptidyl-prolyl isomerase